MRSCGRLLTAIALLCLWPAARLPAAPLLSSVQLVADSAVAGATVPALQTFTLKTAGNYLVTLTDLQLPTGLSSLSLAIVTSTGTAVALSSAGTQSLTLEAGTYSAQVLAVAASGAVGGAFSAQLAPAAGGAAVWQYEGTVGPASPAPSTGQGVLSAKFSVPSAGNYQLTVADLHFPVALSSVVVTVLNDCGLTPGCVTAPVSPTPLTGTGIQTSLSLEPGNYQLFLFAQADPIALQGLFSVQVTDSAAALIYAATQAVGELPSAIPIEVPSAGPVRLTLADLAAPAALGSLQLVIAQDGSVLQQLNAAGSSEFTAATGQMQLYVSAQAQSTQGAWEAYLTSGGRLLADIARATLAPGSYGYAYAGSTPNAGQYQLSLYDFKLPSALSALNGVVTQAAAVLGRTTQGTVSFNLSAGPFNVLVFPVLGSATSNGLFSAQVNATNSGATAWQTTQGVGARFASQTVSVASAGNYELTLSDLRFPASFSLLGAILTRGNESLGQVDGSGKVGFSATPGNYVVNVLSQVGNGVDYGLYGTVLDAAPAPPTVTLTASPNSVTTGQSATLTWSSTGASSCVASGGWSGSQSTSGTLMTAALTATTSFILSCSAADGQVATAQTAVQVDSAAKSTSSGGGSWSVLDLLALGATSFLRLRQRRERQRIQTTDCPDGLVSFPLLVVQCKMSAVQSDCTLTYGKKEVFDV